MTCLRIWRTGLDVTRLDEYERFVDERSRPMFTVQSGFRGVIFSRSGDEIAVLSFWDDQRAIETLEGSETYQQTVQAITAAGFLTDDSTVDVFEIEAGVLAEAREILPD